jgi:hypothetical protein
MPTAAQKREYAKRWRIKNAARVALYQKKYQQRNRGKITAQTLAGSRRRRGLPTPTRPCPQLCECCGRKPTSKGINLDHDHVTGKFRGWICSRCNAGIGFLGDSLEGVLSAINYLKRHL